MSELEDAIVQARRDVYGIVSLIAAAQAAGEDIITLLARLDAALARLERLVRLQGQREANARIAGDEGWSQQDIDECDAFAATEAEIAEAVK